MNEIHVGRKTIGGTNRCFVIAEIGINFNGSLELAKKLIDVAVDAGCDAAKFQAFSVENLYPKTAGDLDWESGTGAYSYSIYDQVKKFEMPPAWIPELIRYCNDRNILFFCSNSDEQSADVLERQGVLLFKSTSYDITNLPLIEHLAKKNKPLILSTGGATLEEIKEAYAAARKHTDKIMLLHCFIKYPAPLAELNLNVIETLQKEFPDAIIGYSDHSKEPCDAPVAAIAKGAKVIEKHITLDKKLDGPDHFFALEPAELQRMVDAIRSAEQARARGEPVPVHPLVLGSPEKRVSSAEQYLRDFAYRTIISTARITRGEPLSAANIKILRPGKLKRGLDPKHYPALITGQVTATKDIEEGRAIGAEDASLFAGSRR